MTITSISSVINSNFLQKLGGASSGGSVQTKGSSEPKNAVEATLTGLSNGARVFSRALQGLNSLISFVNITRNDLDDFKKITTEMVSVVTKATKAGIGQSTRTALNGEFEDLVIDFKKKVSKLKGREYDGIKQSELEEVFTLLGFDKKTSKSFAALLKQFDFVDNEDGKSVLVSDISQAKRPIAIPQAALQAQVRNVYANGDGTFYAKDNRQLTGGSNIVSSATGDANNDGRNEIAFLDSNGVAFVGSKDADGTFRSAVSMQLVPPGHTPGKLSFSDINNDGFDDLVGYSAFSGQHFLNFALSNGDGTFQGSVQNQLSLTGDDVIYQNLNFNLTDFDQDGVADLIYTDVVFSELSFRKGNGDGTFGSALNLNAAITDSGAIQVGDVNGDGNSDVVALNGFGFSVVKGNGDGTFTDSDNYNDTLSLTDAQNIILGDVDGNNSNDIVFSDGNTGQIKVWINDGTGNYSAGAVLNGSTGLQSLYFNDVNNDGINDIIAINSSDSSISTFFGNGNGTFQDRIVTQLQRTPGAAVVDDFNNDGLTEIITGNFASAGNSSFTTLDSTRQVVETSGVRSSGEDFATLFATRRNILTRPAAFRMLADVKALNEQIDNNLSTLEKTFDYVVKNMQMLRQVGLSFIDAAKEVGDRSITDPETIASIVQQKVRSGARGTLSVLENLNSIIAVSESRVAKATKAAAG